MRKIAFCERAAAKQAAFEDMSKEYNFLFPMDDAADLATIYRLLEAEERCDGHYTSVA